MLINGLYLPSVTTGPQKQEYYTYYPNVIIKMETKGKVVGI